MIVIRDCDASVSIFSQSDMAEIYETTVDQSQSFLDLLLFVSCQKSKGNFFLMTMLKF